MPTFHRNGAFITSRHIAPLEKNDTFNVGDRCVFYNGSPALIITAKEGEVCAVVRIDAMDDEPIALQSKYLRKHFLDRFPFVPEWNRQHHNKD